MRNDLNGMIAEIEDLDAQISGLKDRKDNLTKSVITLVQSDIQDQIGLNDYGCGTVTIKTDDFNLKVIVSKKIVYDQNKLSNLYEQIKTSGHNPDMYIKTQYKVSEAVFKTWPTEIQDAFFDAREVSQSKPTIKIERK